MPKFHGENFRGCLYNHEIRECFLPQKCCQDDAIIAGNFQGIKET